MPKRTATLVLMTLLCCTMAHGEGDGDKSQLAVDGDRTKAYVAYLCRDAMEGRASCTEGYRQAADWVAGNFRRWGLKPAGEDGTYFQKVKIREFDWTTGLPSLSVAGRKFLFDDADYSLDMLSTVGVTKQAEVIFVGYGIAAPDRGLDEYDGMAVKDKIVLVLKGSPKDAPESRRMFSPADEKGEESKKEEEWKEESTDLSKIKTAYEKGAAAVLLFDPAATSQSTSRRRPQKTAFTPDRDFLCFVIGERIFRAIMKRDPQESPSGLKRRIDAIRRDIKAKTPRSQATGIRVTLKGYDSLVRYDEEHGNNTARNVLAKIEGTDPELKDQYILVGAHLDHIGMRNGYVNNGADDNASGSAVVMEVARVLAEGGFKPKRTLLFACWCGEERGLIGSLYYTDKPCDGVSIDNTVACFNADMVGMGTTLRASGALNFPSIWEVIKRDQGSKVIEHVKPSEGGTGGSDHTGFIKRGIESMHLMSFGGVGHQDYHQPEDDIEKIEPEMLRITGQFILQGMMNLAVETETNLIIDRRQELYHGLRMRIANLNPDLENSLWTKVAIKKKEKEALYEEIHNRARELFKAAASGRLPTGDSSPHGKQALTRGSSDLALAADDVGLLKLMIDYHGIGRADIKGDDGTWVVDGRLTDHGKAALKVLEENNVFVRLVSPGADLIGDVLSSASKPFVITGEYEILEKMVDRLNSRGVRFGVNCNPKDVNGFIARLEQVKSQLRERKNLFLFLTATEGLDEAKRPLYLGLIDRGWTHNEINGNREHRGLIGGGNLSSIGK
ncbi:MAG: M20/M25/M40 family metallo-hydrolase [Planctomycetes bacterium]|nr:M20/M25/M40 family metallo-hydrolase [Planctomycetota bacterium]